MTALFLVAIIGLVTYLTVTRTDRTPQPVEADARRERIRTDEV
jgi:hypothetical protein